MFRLLSRYKENVSHDEKGCCNMFLYAVVAFSVRKLCEVIVTTSHESRVGT
jgi:hypothetical protein